VPALLSDPGSAAPEGGPDLQALAEGLVASNQVGLDQVGLDRVDLNQADLNQVDLVQADLNPADSNQAYSVQVDLDQADLDQVDLDAPVSFDRVGSVGLDDSEFPAWVAAPEAGPEFPGSVAVPTDGPACLVLAGEFPADCHRGDFLAGCIPADCPVRTADDCSPDRSPDDWGDDSFSDDSASRRDNPDGWPTRSVADDTRGAAADKDSPSHPTRRGCSTRGAIPSSIPIRPIPRAGCLPAAPRFRFPLRR
jgi:Pentapeptide repeats (8 copies)